MYGGAIALVRLASSALAAIAPHSTGKLNRALIARNGLIARWIEATGKKRDRTRPLVWFHAPSVGEGLQARPVIDALRRVRPDVQIAYSFFSPSAETFAKSLKVDLAEYLPFDSAGDAQLLLNAVAPTALVFVKLDVWPQLVKAAHDNGVVTGLLSATVAPASGRRGVLAQSILHDAYAALDFVGAIDAVNGERLLGLGVRPDRLSVSGDTRFDQVWARAERVDRESALLQSLRSERPTVVAGSTWPADEAVLLPAWDEIRSHVPRARLIIAVHEPTPAHLLPIEEWASQSGLTCRRLSDMERRGPAPRDAAYAALGNADGAAIGDISAASIDVDATGRTSVDVVVVDRVGVLGELYAIADAAFVGGAFHKAGLHSVLEPAAYGAPVVFGPAYAMSREAGLLIAAGGARSVSTRAECAEVLQEWLTHSEARTVSGAHAKAFVESELGAAERSLQLVIAALR